MMRLGEASRQTVTLYSAQLLSTALNTVFWFVVAKAMPQEDYGVFSFCIFSVVMFLGYLFEFGVFSAGARLLAIADSRDAERRVLGTLCMAGLGIGLLFGVVIAASGPVAEIVLLKFGHQEAALTTPLLAAAPFAIAIPLQQLAELACQGTNRIGALATLRLALPLSSLSLIATLHALVGPISPVPAVVAYLGAILISSSIVLTMLRPSFAIGREDFEHLGRAIREYGLDIYAGRVVSMMSLRLDQILIPVFVGPRRWGAYKIAQQVSEPISNLARAFATTRFKAFAGAREVDARIVRWNIALLAAAAAGLAIAGPWIFTFIFPNKYRNALPLFLPFALVAFFGGLGQPYNMFLGAHGAGRALRNIALAVGSVNVFGLFVFTRRYGIDGAAWFAVASMALNFALHVYYYRKLLREQSVVSSQ